LSGRVRVMEFSFNHARVRVVVFTRNAVSHSSVESDSAPIQLLDRVINVWNALPSAANFASLNVLGIALKRLISLVILLCNIFICAIEYAPSDCLYRTFYGSC